ncbi:MAG: CoA transferase [Sphingomicrobium sp.]
MAQKAVTGEAARPMPVRVSAWAIYDVFETRNDGEQLFVGVVSDAQWTAFTGHFDLGEIGRNPDYAKNNQRVLARDTIVPAVRALFKERSRAELVVTLEGLGLPFAPITRPDELFDDPHLNAAGGLVDVTLDDGSVTKLPALPIEFDGPRERHAARLPQPGQDSRSVLAELGYAADEIDALTEAAVVA